MTLLQLRVRHVFFRFSRPELKCFCPDNPEEQAGERAAAAVGVAARALRGGRLRPAGPRARLQRRRARLAAAAAAARRPGRRQPPAAQQGDTVQVPLRPRASCR